MFQTLLGALGAFVGITFVSAAGRKYYDNNLDKKELAEFIGSCFQLILFFSIIVFLLVFTFKDQLSTWLSLKPSYVLLAVFVASCTVIINLRLGQWQVRKSAFKYGALQISQSILNLILSLIFVVVFLKGADGRINAQILVSVLFVIVAIYLLKKDSLFKVFIWRKKYLSEAISFGVPLIPHVAGTFLLMSVDRFIINKEIGLSEAGIYMVAVQLTFAVSIVFDAVNKAYVPWLFEKLKEGNFKEKLRIVKLTYIWFVIIIVGIILSFVIGPPLVVLIAGEQYVEAGKVIGLLVMGQGFKGMYLMVTNYIFFSKKTGLLSLISLCSGFLNLFLLLILIPRFGIKGAAIAFAFTMGVRFLLTWWVAQKRHPMPWFSLNS